MKEEKLICGNLTVNDAGHLCIAGQDTAELARRYGTPLYLLDEDRIRENCRTYTRAFRECCPDGSQVLYASKACSFKQMYRIMHQEGMCADVVSAGEIATAVRAGFDPEKLYFHGNCKTDADIRFALEHGVGCIVIDNPEDVESIEAAAAALGLKQKVLMRVTPGIDPHTYDAVNTGMVDSKFGAAIETGQAAELAKAALAQPHLELIGFHCHVGSEVFGEDVFERSAAVMMKFMADFRAETGYVAPFLDLGGGYGVRYVESDPYVDIAAKIRALSAAVKAEAAKYDYPMPALMLEPGRSIVADAGLTLYTVGTVKTIPGYKNYVAVDGGMADNPRYALYGARYTCLPASRMNEDRPVIADLVGCCCESGDILQPKVAFPEGMKRGDLAAVCITGAYNYSMASNYNRIPRPPVVMLAGGESTVAVRRETFDDLTRLDV